jgi:hypothetical protein
MSKLILVLTVWLTTLITAQAVDVIAYKGTLKARATSADGAMTVARMIIAIRSLSGEGIFATVSIDKKNKRYCG